MRVFGCHFFFFGIHQFVVTINVVVTKQTASIHTGANCMLENRCTCSTQIGAVYVNLLKYFIGAVYVNLLKYFVVNYKRKHK